nr:DUF5937 family protein [Kitasatospora sp. MAP12-44]
MTFSARDLAYTRLAVSPMWEVVTSLRTLNSPAPRPLHRRWVARTRPRVAEAGLTSGLLAGLIPEHGYLPDFLNPPPETAEPTLAVELDRIAATPYERIRAELTRLPSWTPAVRSLHDDPGAGLDRLLPEIDAYWEAALAAHWPRLRGVLEADVLHQSRRFAAEGYAAVLRELHPQVGWGDEILTLQTCCGGSGELEGRGLLLMPSAFVWPSVLVVNVAPAAAQLCYPSRGVGALWEQAAPEVPQAVAAVLGRSRALLLTELSAPASTTELARRTGMSAGGISEHLTALRAAGIVSSQRSGRSVLYRRTSVADTLLAAAGA